jgi:NAD(P)-dependent dehydrogenase (short-subunit alcohol dehydrogenase family)
VGRLEGRVAVVVGAGSIGAGWSNGKACSVGYGQEGASVVCVDFHLARAEQAAADIEERGAVALPIQADATKEADVQAVIDLAVGRFGESTYFTAT